MKTIYKHNMEDDRGASSKQMDGQVKVLGYWSIPFSRRVDLALRLKGVPYDYIEEDIRKKSSMLLEYNPIYQEVPILVHGGKPIVGSLVILEYIEDKWSGYPLLPNNPNERARARFLANFIDEKCLPIFRVLFWDDGDIQKPMEQAKENLTILEAELKGKIFFGGDTIGLLDIAANYIALWVGVLQEMAEINLFNKENFPKLWKWSQEFLGCHVVQKSLPERNRLLAYFQARKKAIRLAKASAN